MKRSRQPLPEVRPPATTTTRRIALAPLRDTNHRASSSTGAPSSTGSSLLRYYKNNNNSNSHSKGGSSSSSSSDTYKKKQQLFGGAAIASQLHRYGTRGGTPTHKNNNHNNNHASTNGHGGGRNRGRPTLRRKVWFPSVQVEKVHENHIRLTARDIKNLWYSSAELKTMSHDAKRDQEDLFGRDAILHTHSHLQYLQLQQWMTTHTRIYQSFVSTTNDAHDIMNTINQAPAQVFYLHGVGLEKRIPEIMQDFGHRRRTLFSHVAQVEQSATIRSDPTLRSQMLRQVSRAVSKPARLYARHVAYHTAVADVY